MKANDAKRVEEIREFVASYRLSPGLLGRLWDDIPFLLSLVASQETERAGLIRLTADLTAKLTAAEAELDALRKVAARLEYEHMGVLCRQKMGSGSCVTCDALAAWREKFNQ